MKKLFTFIMALFLTASAVQANNADLFQLDEQTLKVEMAELDQLEEYVTENNLQWEDLQDIDKVNFDSSVSLMAADFSVDDMEWGSFAWGFCCPVGFFVVALNDDKTQDEKLSFWIGTITATLIYSAIFGGWRLSL